MSGKMMPELTEEEYENLEADCVAISEMFEGKSALEIMIILSVITDTVVEQLPEEVRGYFVKMIMGDVSIL